ncbi:glycine betaine ABC transporter substrate-binding protein [Ammoniphilus sp. 3BR4]|uniref:glycine betaine ABC transporter substrate-binding protein n=1 Tax=Ammoniphilus sp. 3BR4 TaxID=3158265 RepID=UPI0034662058
MKKLSKKTWLSLFLSVSMLLLSACGSSNQDTAGQSGNQSEPAAGKSKGSISVGGKDFTEQMILSKITSIYLGENGYEVKEAGSMGSSVVRSALENKQIDLYWEYTGTGLIVYQKQAVETDPEKAYEKVKENDKKNNLVWLNKADFNNTYAILMPQAKADELGIKSISDLAKFVSEKPDHLKFATNAEFYAREDGVKGLEKTYEFQFPIKNVVKMDSGLLYNALKDGQVEVSVGFATDGRIKGFNLVALEDDKQFFPAYNAAPVTRKELIDTHPEVADLMNQVSEKLNTETMMQLNYMVDVEHKDVTEVAREWLVSQKFIK